MNRKYLIVAAAILALAIAGMVYYVHYQRSFTPEGIYSSNGRLEMTLINAATIYPGRVAEVLVAEGDHVQKDQALIHMQATDADAQIAVANAARRRGIEAKTRARSEAAAYQQKLKVSRLDYQNAVRMYHDHLVSNAELVKRKAQMAGDEASVKAASAAVKEADAAIGEAQANIDRLQSVKKDLTVKSPLDGRVESQLVEVGSVIGQGTRVFTLLDYKNVYMNIFLTTRSIANIRLGDEARIVLDNLDGVFPATIQYISSEAQFTPKYVETQQERDTMAYRVKLKIPEEIAIKYNELLKNGLTGVGYVKTDAQQHWPERLQIKLPKN